MDELVRSDLQATRRRRPILPVWLPGTAARAIRAGVSLARDRAVGRRTCEDFLAESWPMSRPRARRPADQDR